MLRRTSLAWTQRLPCVLRSVERGALYSPLNRCFASADHSDDGAYTDVRNVVDPRPQFQKYRGAQQHNPMQREISEQDKQSLYEQFMKPKNPVPMEELAKKYQISFDRCRAIIRLRDIRSDYMQFGFEPVEHEPMFENPQDSEPKNPGAEKTIFHMRLALAEQAEEFSPPDGQYPASNVWVSLADHESAESVVTKLRYQAAVAERRDGSRMPKDPNPAKENPHYFNISRKSGNRRYKVLVEDISKKKKRKGISKRYKVYEHDRVLRKAKAADLKHRQTLFYELPSMASYRHDLAGQ